MNKELKNLFILIFVFLFASILLWAKSSNMLIDFSREAMIPYQMISGQVLIKDIFLIYGFLGYFINSFLIKWVFNVNILLFEAHIVSSLILILFYLILRKFSSKTTSFVFSLFFIFISIFSSSTFSFVVPYSYSTLWGVLFCYCVLFSLLYKKDILLYLSLGFLLVSKIEFFIPVFLICLVYKIYNRQKLDFKVLSFFMPLLFFVFYVFKNNITLNDFFVNFSYLIKMTKTDAIQALYKSVGSFFEIHYFIFSLFNLIIYLLFFVLSYFSYLKNKKLLSVLLLVFPFFLLKTVFILNLGVFVLIGLTIYLLKNKKLNENDILLFVFCLVFSLKSFFALNFVGYLNFGFCLVVFNIYLFLSKILNKNYLKIHFYILLSFLTILNISDIFQNQKLKLETNFGKISLKKNDNKLLSEINTFLKENLKEKDSLIVLPEGQIVNLANKKGWDFYNSTFIPLDFETFGEENLIKKLKENKTEFLLFYPRNTVEYGKKTICYDYGVDFCLFVIDNYDRINIFEDEYKAIIFRIKDYEK